nr:hypothetical protein CFP56_54934 [Quercus suber]
MGFGDGGARKGCGRCKVFSRLLSGVRAGRVVFPLPYHQVISKEKKNRQSIRIPGHREIFHQGHAQHKKVATVCIRNSDLAAHSRQASKQGTQTPAPLRRKNLPSKRVALEEQTRNKLPYSPAGPRCNWVQTITSEFENLEQSVVQDADVVVDEHAFVGRAAFAHDADERDYALVDAAVVAGRWRVLLLLLPAVDLLDVDDDVDVIGADLVIALERGAGVGGDVEFAGGVEEVGLLDAAGGAQLVEQSLEGGQGRQQFLQDLAHRFEDARVENARLMIADARVPEAHVRELVLHALAHLAEGLVAVLLRQPVDLVDEDLEVDPGMMLREPDRRAEQCRHRVLVLILDVEDPDRRAVVVEDLRMIDVREGVTREVMRRDLGACDGYESSTRVCFNVGVANHDSRRKEFGLTASPTIAPRWSARGRVFLPEVISGRRLSGWMICHFCSRSTWSAGRRYRSTDELAFSSP